MIAAVPVEQEDPADAVRHQGPQKIVENAVQGFGPER